MDGERVKGGRALEGTSPAVSLIHVITLEELNETEGDHTHIEPPHDVPPPCLPPTHTYICLHLLSICFNLVAMARAFEFQCDL